MHRFEVVTPELGGAAARIAGAGAELDAAVAALERVTVAGPAADHPGVTAATGRLVAAWMPAVSAMQVGAGALGQRVSDAGTAYEQTDRGAMQGR